MLFLERMDVHRWSAHSGPNPTQQGPARIPSGLPELYRVPNNWVVESLSCPRHSSYTSSRSPPKRCGHCINTVRAHEHGPALASSKANFVELRYGEVRAGVKVCIAPPRQDPDCASEVCPYSAPSIVCVRVHQTDRSGR